MSVIKDVLDWRDIDSQASPNCVYLLIDPRAIDQVRAFAYLRPVNTWKVRGPRGIYREVLHNSLVEYARVELEVRAKSGDPLREGYIYLVKAEDVAKELLRLDLTEGGDACVE